MYSTSVGLKDIKIMKKNFEKDSNTLLDYHEALKFLMGLYNSNIEEVFNLKYCSKCKEVLTSRNTNNISDVICTFCKED